MFSTNPDDFFESDSIRAKREYQRGRISYTKGNPFRLSGKILCLANHSSDIIGAGCSNGIAYVLSFTNKLSTTATCKGHSGPISAISFFQRDHQLLLFTGSWDRSVKIFDAWNGALLKTFHQILPDLIKSISVLPICDSSLIIIGDARGTLCIFDTFHPNPSKFITKVCNRTIESIKVADSCIYIAGSDGTLSSWELGLSALDPDCLTDLAKALSGRFKKNENLFSADEDQHSTSVYALEYLYPDTLITGSADGYIFSWDIPSGRKVWSSHDLKGWIRSIVVPKSRNDLFVVGMSDGTINVFRNQILEFSIINGGHFDAVTASITIYKDQTEFFVSGSLDGTIRSWIIPPPTSYSSELQEMPVVASSFLSKEDMDELDELLDDEERSI